MSNSPRSDWILNESKVIRFNIFIVILSKVNGSRILKENRNFTTVRYFFVNIIFSYIHNEMNKNITYFLFYFWCLLNTYFTFISIF